METFVSHTVLRSRGRPILGKILAESNASSLHDSCGSLYTANWISYWMNRIFYPINFPSAQICHWLTFDAQSSCVLDSLRSWRSCWRAKAKFVSGEAAISERHNVRGQQDRQLRRLRTRQSRLIIFFAKLLAILFHQFLIVTSCIQQSATSSSHRTFQFLDNQDCSLRSILVFFVVWSCALPTEFATLIT